MKKLLLIILLLPSLAFGAITERYVNAAGSGSADGTLGNDMSFATFIDYMIAGGSFTAAAGYRFNLKQDGTYARTTTTDTWVNGGTATSPVIVRGYKTAITDGNLGRTNGNGALITTNMPVITYTTGRLNAGSANFVIYESLNISGAPSNVVFQPGSSSVVKTCKIVNSSTNSGAICLGSGASNVVFDCDIELTGASGGGNAVTANSSGLRVLCSRIKGGPAIGIIASNSAVIAGNVIFASTGNHISMTSTSGTPTFLFNTLVGGGADAINIITGTTVLQCLVGNMITDNTGDGIDMVSTANAAFLAYNRTRDNANGVNNGGDWITATQYGVVTTDTGGPETDYVNSGGNDYRLLQTSPAKGTGWFFYRDIGALQHLDPHGVPVRPH